MFGFGLNSKKWVKESQKTEKETKKKAGQAFHTWKNIKTTFAKDMLSFEELHLDNQGKISGSLVYSEMVSFNKRLSVVEALATWGYYHSSLQELLFILETAILAYYLDQQLPNTDHASKINLMQKHKGELWGTRLRRRAFMHERDLGAEIEKVVEDINNSIDQYLADNLVDTWKQEFLPFDAVEFNDCVRNTENVLALLIKLFTNRFGNFRYSGNIKITHSDAIEPEAAAAIESEKEKEEDVESSDEE